MGFNSLGRFLTPDPFLDPSNRASIANRYAYVGNDPINRWDPFGFHPDPDEPDYSNYSEEELCTGSCEIPDKLEMPKKSGDSQGSDKGKSGNAGGAPGGEAPPGGPAGPATPAGGGSTDSGGSAPGEDGEDPGFELVLDPDYQPSYDEKIFGLGGEPVSCTYSGTCDGPVPLIILGRERIPTPQERQAEQIGVILIIELTPIGTAMRLTDPDVPLADKAVEVVTEVPIFKIIKIGKTIKKVDDAVDITNEVPTDLARVIPGEGPFPTLGKPGTPDVFVTAPEDIAGLNAREIAQRLTIDPSETFTVITFRTPATGLASPVNRTNPGFVGRGRTAGGAREFMLSNGRVPAGATVQIVK